MTADPSMEAASPQPPATSPQPPPAAPRARWRTWLVRLLRDVRLLIVVVCGIGGLLIGGLIIAGAVNDQVLSATGSRTQAMVVDYRGHDLVVAFPTSAGQPVRATIGLEDHEQLSAFPLESVVGVIYDPDHPSTADLGEHVLGIGASLDRVGMGLLMLTFCVGLIWWGALQAARQWSRGRGRPPHRMAPGGNGGV